MLATQKEIECEFLGGHIYLFLTFFFPLSFSLYLSPSRSLAFSFSEISRDKEFRNRDHATCDDSVAGGMVRKEVEG